MQEALRSKTMVATCSVKYSSPMCRSRKRRECKQAIRKIVLEAPADGIADLRVAVVTQLVLTNGTSVVPQNTTASGACASCNFLDYSYGCTCAAEITKKRISTVATNATIFVSRLQCPVSAIIDKLGSPYLTHYNANNSGVEFDI
jgi:hypothetical protein